MILSTNVKRVASVETGRNRRIVIERDLDRGALYLRGEVQGDDGQWEQRGVSIVPKWALIQFVGAVNDALAEALQEGAA